MERKKDHGAGRGGCGGVMLEAGVSGAFIGGALGGGLAAGQYFAQRAKNMLPPGSSGARTIGTQFAKSGVGFGLFLATFNGGMCLCEAARGGKRDAANAAVAGGVAGFLGALPRFLKLGSSDPNAMVAFRNPRFLAAQTLGTALVGALVFTLLPDPPPRAHDDDDDDNDHFGLPMLNAPPTAAGGAGAGDDGGAGGWGAGAESGGGGGGGGSGAFDEWSSQGQPANLAGGTDAWGDVATSPSLQHEID